MQKAKAIEPRWVYEEDSTLLTTTIQVVVTKGSNGDPAGRNGLMNLLGELLLRGTRKNDRNEFQKKLEQMGGAIDARVSSDLTVFSASVIRENTMPFIKLLQDCLLDPAFSKKEFNALQRELLAEVAHVKNSNFRLGGLALRRELFAGTPVAEPPQGGLKSLRAIQLKEVVKAYNEAYVQGNFVFGIASPLPEAEMKAAFLKLYRKLPEGNASPLQSVPAQKPPRNKLILIHKAGTATGSVVIGQPGITASDPTRYALLIGNFSFGGEPLVSRLFRTIRGEHGWTYAIQSLYHAMGPLNSQQGLYVILSTPTVEFTSKALFKTLSMWQDYLDQGLTPPELSLAQDSTVNSYPFEFDSAEKRVAQKLQSMLYGIPLLSQDEFGKKIRSISNGEIQKTLKTKQLNTWVITVVADKDVMEKQLAEEQKNVPESARLRIDQVLTPDDLVN